MAGRLIWVEERLGSIPSSPIHIPLWGYKRSTYSKTDRQQGYILLVKNKFTQYETKSIITYLLLILYYPYSQICTRLE